MSNRLIPELTCDNCGKTEMAAKDWLSFEIMSPEIRLFTAQGVDLCSGCKSITVEDLMESLKKKALSRGFL